jgi:hypothetical protein
LVIEGVVAEERPWVDLDVYVHEWTELSMMDGTGLVPLKDGTLSLFIEGGDDPMGAAYEDFSAVADVLRQLNLVGRVEAIYLDSFYSLQFASLPDALDALQQMDGPEVYIGPEDEEDRDWVFCVTTSNEIVGLGAPAVDPIEGIVNE